MLWVLRRRTDLCSADNKKLGRKLVPRAIEYSPLARGPRASLRSLLREKHRELFTKLHGHLYSQRTKVFDRQRRVDGEGQQAFERAIAPASPKTSRDLPGAAKRNASGASGSSGGESTYRDVVAAACPPSATSRCGPIARSPAPSPRSQRGPLRRLVGHPTASRDWMTKFLWALAWLKSGH